jgi:hypothetical protein
MKAVLVWVDEFETFYQIPEKVFNEFQNTESYNRLEELGFSLHDESSGFKFLDKKTNQLNELINQFK